MRQAASPSPCTHGLASALLVLALNLLPPLVGHLEKHAASSYRRNTKWRGWGHGSWATTEGKTGLGAATYREKQGEGALCSLCPSYIQTLSLEESSPFPEGSAEAGHLLVIYLFLQRASSCASSTCSGVFLSQPLQVLSRVPEPEQQMPGCSC